MTNCPKDLVPNDQQAKCNHILGLSHHSVTLDDGTYTARSFVYSLDRPNTLKVYGGTQFDYCPKCGQELEHS